MRLPQNGGCLCGAARYEVTRAPLAAYTCHCTHCQRLTSSAFSTGVVVAAEACRFFGIELRSFQRVAESGRQLTRWACPECASPMCSGAKPGTVPPGGFAFLRAGTLDDPSWLRPTVHFWTRSAQPWVTLPEGGTHFETQPPDYVAWLRSIGNHQHRSDH